MTYYAALDVGLHKTAVCIVDEDGAVLAERMIASEVDDLIAGLDLQRKAALATQEHLTTTLHALEARLADARRRQQQLTTGESGEPEAAPSADASATAPSESRAAEIESDLEALRRELGQS